MPCYAPVCCVAARSMRATRARSTALLAAHGLPSAPHMGSAHASIAPRGGSTWLGLGLGFGFGFGYAQHLVRVRVRVRVRVVRVVRVVRGRV